MAQITNFDRETFLIHALELKLWLFEVSLGSHSLAMFGKKILWAREKFYGRAAYVDDPLPNIVHIRCLLALYGSTMHPARLCGGFPTIFFCLVCGPLVTH